MEADEKPRLIWDKGCLILLAVALFIASLAACGYVIMLMIATQEFMETF